MNSTMHEKILIIDDDADFSESIATYLRQHDYMVLLAHDGDEGVALAAAERPAVIICDVMMKERTEGFFTVQRLRRTQGLETTPIFVISSVYDAVPSFRVEPDESWLAQSVFISKPVNPDELLQKIALAIEGQAAT